MKSWHMVDALNVYLTFEKTRMHFVNTGWFLSPVYNYLYLQIFLFLTRRLGKFISNVF